MERAIEVEKYGLLVDDIDGPGSFKELFEGYRSGIEDMHRSAEARESERPYME